MRLEDCEVKDIGVWSIGPLQRSQAEPDWAAASEKGVIPASLMRLYVRANFLSFGTSPTFLADKHHQLFSYFALMLRGLKGSLTDADEELAGFDQAEAEVYDPGKQARGEQWDASAPGRSKKHFKLVLLSLCSSLDCIAELTALLLPNSVPGLKLGKADFMKIEDWLKLPPPSLTVEMDPKAKQGDLFGALEPVVNRLLTQYKSAQVRLLAAQSKQDSKAAGEAQDDLETLILFKRDMGTFQHAYTFLSQIFDYSNTAIESRYIFYRRLVPLLEFGRERERLDLSKVVLTHHNLKNKGKQAMLLGDGEQPKLMPLTESGSGTVQEKEKALLAEIIAKVNDLFDGELTEDDKLVYVNNVIKGKLLESEVLVQQASNNTKEQFANSPDLAHGILNAVMDAFAAHATMSKQALDSEKVRSGLKDVLLGPAQLYEALRAKGDLVQVGDGQ
jgi:hypothetical protein